MMKTYFLYALLLCMGLAGTVPAWGAEIPADVAGNSYPLPLSVDGVRRPVICLNGHWQFRFTDRSPWTQIQVPGEVAMQGYGIAHDTPFYYKKTVDIPADYAGHRIILRFDGVYSHAWLYVNGTEVREHHGGFTRWETDITPYVRTGKKNQVMLKVEDRLDDISYASGYAHHPIGGILRDVTLFALPAVHVCDVSADSELDARLEDGRLLVGCKLQGEGDCRLHLRLTDANGRVAAERTQPLRAGNNQLALPVSRPHKWDAEHPYLYTLQATVICGERTAMRFEKHIGFRKIEIQQDRLLVNGMPVKLRGACRHDIHATWGRSTTRETDSLDVRLFKEANMNFVRTSHYPPTERFLDFCDRYGIYVESESAVCFVNTHRQKNYAPGDSQDKPEFRNRYLGQLQEMVKTNRIHPSVVVWSIGNESMYGSNFQASWDWLKASDTTRPVIFSYPGTTTAQKAQIFDILSMHYQDVYGNLDQWGMSTRGFQGHGMPALFDEWAHPACYTYATLRDDPNIREFSGQSLDKMWAGLFEAPGGLGGAIWGYVDELFYLPKPKMGSDTWKTFAHTAKPEGFRGDCVGYGEWGIVDVWRRKKPEFWATKKAYSPIRVMAGRTLDYTAGQPIVLTVHNRFDHTCLSEVKATMDYHGETVTLNMEALPPHQKGILVLPAHVWEEGAPVQLAFYTAAGELIDRYRFTLGEERIEWPATMAGKTLRVEESEAAVKIGGEGFAMVFSKETGLATGMTAEGDTLLKEGPYLHLYVNLNHLSGAEVRKIASYVQPSAKDWKLSAFAYRQTGDGVYVVSEGSYGDIKVKYDIKVSADGELAVNYVVTGAPNGFVRESGVGFLLPAGYRELAWKRKGYWDCYPEDQLSGNEGRVPLFQSRQVAYGKTPVQPWAYDTHDYYYWSDAGACCRKPLTQVAKGMKEHTYYYTLLRGDRAEHALSVVSATAGVACRLQQSADGALWLYANNRWDYPEIAWGNYCKQVEALPCYGAVTMRLK